MKCFRNANESGFQMTDNGDCCMSDEDDPFETSFNYSIDKDGVKQGAEARIYECVYLGRPAMLKERFEKKYRHETLDKRLNKTRLKNELKGIVKAQGLGVEVPCVYFVDNDKNAIIMEKIIGCTAKDWIETRREELKEDRAAFEEQTYGLGLELGYCVGKLHAGGLIHGDLTTSNVIMRDGNQKRPVFIDFGLSLQGKMTAEDKGVDLYVLERAMASTHVDSTNTFDGFIEGYKKEGGKQATAVLEKLDEIRLRGRKRDMVG